MFTINIKLNVSVRLKNEYHTEYREFEKKSSFFLTFFKIFLKKCYFFRNLADF
jgi:hypothetical protein